jgi:hypothetical protein
MSQAYADRDGASRAAYLKSIGRSDGLRPLAPGVQAKVDRALAIQAKRDAMTRVRLAVARIGAELLRRLEHARRAGGGADPDYLLVEVRALRADLAKLEV